jgi:hypothetical protein
LGGKSIRFGFEDMKMRICNILEGKFEGVAVTFS